MLTRGARKALNDGYQVVYIDFLGIPFGKLKSLDQLLNYIAVKIAQKLTIPIERVAGYWKLPYSSTDKLSNFIETEVLGATNKQCLIAVDEVDRVLTTDYKEDFFGYLRSWNTMQATEPLWTHLSLVLVISTHPLLLISDLHQSPFNVGETLELEDFTVEQVLVLDASHGSVIPRAEVDTFMSFFGGHPYLVRQSLYTLAYDKMPWRQLLKTATAASGPFRQHLQLYSNTLKQNRDLLTAFRAIIKHGRCPDEATLYRLIAAGLVRETSTGCEVRCGLYETYFGGKLR